jgi:hypothetical protein
LLVTSRSAPMSFLASFERLTFYLISVSLVKKQVNVRDASLDGGWTG